jgi:type II restriction/modification system DNA methylase subunit YeeA
MDTSKLKKFAQFARRNLIEQVKSKLKLVLADESAARREHPKAVKDLEQKLNQHSDKKEGEEQLIDQVAYTWFNRFCALRFMDVNQYNRIMVLSPISGQFQPEILAEAKAGHLDETVFNDKARENIQGLLSGSVPSRDGQAEAYRLMIVAVCNDYYRLMPYLFERIEDYTELLMPDNLLSGNSILAYTREAMTPENCESVESIGWLYQFYISEKKDQVFEGLKKNIKITPENIPAATQLFTPHWIVRYLVENSLGRLWMLNNPESELIDKMEFYITPDDDETDFLKVNSPEELKVCDSACGSGHILTYAYDLLYAIYVDANYDPVDIPELILTKNLYGIEIDERAAELAAFALSMKAIKGNPLDEGNNRRRFFRNPIKPNICRLGNIDVGDEVLDKYINQFGIQLFTPKIIETIKQFNEADNFGSLIIPKANNLEHTIGALDKLKQRSGLGLGNPEALSIVEQVLVRTDNFEKVCRVLKQADYLSSKYHVVIANPPYLGSKGMNGRLTKWAKNNYPDSRSDLFAMFIERNLLLAVEQGYSSMINMQSWMFLSSFEKLRKKILNKSTITSMAHLGTRAFDSIGGEVVSTTAYILKNKLFKKYKGTYLRLVTGKSELEKEQMILEAVRGSNKEMYFNASSRDFNKIPGSPIAYWMSDKVGDLFDTSDVITEISPACIGMMTTDNDRFLRRWWEPSISSISFNSQSIEESVKSLNKWFPYNKGGSYRKWAGNKEYVVNWQNEGEKIKENGMTSFRGKNFYFRQGITWSDVTSGNLSCRKFPMGFIHDISGHSVFPDSLNDTFDILAFMNTKFCNDIAKLLNPTLHFQVGDYSKLPKPDKYFSPKITALSKEAVEIAEQDWDESETSWGFSSSLLLQKDMQEPLLKLRYETISKTWKENTKKLLTIEKENNRLFIENYSLESEFTPDVPISEITLNCNPYHRYKSKKSDDAIQYQLKKDSISEFLSYSVGCIFGRYSLDKGGLILANQRDTLEHYLKQVPSPSFMPDEDNVIPIIDFDGDWFEDEVTERFKAFLKVTFGEEHFAENLAFIEDAIGKNIKKYFVKDFYADHVKRYKKRPIYWMFSSPKGSFNALIYIHRYQPDTASIVLNDYLREFRTKLEARKESYEQVEISASASQKDITQAIKAIAKINKVLEEVNDYEHDVLYPLAGKKIEIDLDDGVKHNYPLFGKALKKVTGLS